MDIGLIFPNRYHTAHIESFDTKLLDGFLFLFGGAMFLEGCDLIL